MSIDALQAFFKTLSLSKRQEQIARQIFKEVRAAPRVSSKRGAFLFIARPGLRHPFGRRGPTHPPRHAIGSRLTGVIYILDEPSIGLHPRDNSKLLNTLFSLRDLGNTVVVIEHDKETMLAADHLIDIGPGAGRLGGELVAFGTPSAVMKNPASFTGAYLSGKKTIPLPKERRGKRLS